MNQDAVSVAVSSSLPSGSAFGQVVTYTATVAAISPGAGTPSGIVTFYSDNAIIGTGSLSAGVATLNDSSLLVGTHNIIASYGGDGDFLTGSSASISQTVNQASTTTAAGQFQNPSVSGQSVSFTAAVSVNAPGSGNPMGTVNFFDGSTLLDTETLTVGSATFVTERFCRRLALDHGGLCRHIPIGRKHFQRHQPVRRPGRHYHGGDQLGQPPAASGRMSPSPRRFPLQPPAVERPRERSHFTPMEVSSAAAQFHS